jgi:DNA-binding TFAR19-related protein (PDSD5 family)
LTLLFMALKFLKVTSKTITNNAITPTANHQLSPLRGGHKNLIHSIEDQVIRIIQNILGYM